MKLRKILCPLLIALVCSTNSSAVFANQTPEDTAGGKDWIALDDYSLSYDEKPDYPALNRVSDHPQLGDEHNFVRMAEFNEGDDFSPATYLTEEITLEPDRSYIIILLLHNNCDPALGADATINEPIFTLNLPQTLKANVADELSALIIYEQDEKVYGISNKFKLQSNTDLKLAFSRTAQIVDYSSAVDHTLDNSLVFVEDRLAGVQKLPNLPAGKENERYYVFWIQTTSVDDSKVASQDNPDQSQDIAKSQPSSQPEQHSKKRFDKFNLFLIIGGIVWIIVGLRMRPHKK